MKITTRLVALITTSTLLGSSLSFAQTTIYSENFDPEPDSLIDFNMQLGGIPEQKPINTKIYALGQWGLTQNATIVDIGGANGNTLQPQQDDRNNGRIVGVYLDPAVFSGTGAGTYTLVFDVIPSSTAGAGRVYVGSGSGYDLSAATDAKLNLALSAPGFNVVRGTGEIAWPALTGLNGATATHLTTTTVEWIDTQGNPTGQFRETPGVEFDVEAAETLSVEFEYDGTSTIVIAWAGYNTDYGIDNIAIETAIPDDNMWAGFPIDENGYVDTGDWMGVVYAATEPWIWRTDLGEWRYIPDSAVDEGGAWGYIPK